jgi:hypothetical protein
MAYVSSFAITAFLMFAVGDTKKIIGSMAGMDKTLQQAGMQIVDAGKDMAMAAAKISAGVATGGAAGGALGSQAANAAAKTISLATTAKDQGFKEAWDSLGSFTGNYAEKIKDADTKYAERRGKDRSNLQYLNTSAQDRAKYLNEKTEAAADSWVVDMDGVHGAADKRAVAAGREKNSDAALSKRVSGTAQTNITQAFGDFEVDVDNLKVSPYSKRNDRTGILEKFEFTSPHQHALRYAYKDMKSALNYDNITDKGEQTEALYKAQSMATAKAVLLAKFAQPTPIYTDTGRHLNPTMQGKELTDNMIESAERSLANSMKGHGIKLTAEEANQMTELVMADIKKNASLDGNGNITRFNYFEKVKAKNNNPPTGRQNSTNKKES